MFVDQRSVVEPFIGTDVASAAKSSVGAGFAGGLVTVTVTDMLTLTAWSFEHAKVYVLSLVSTPVDS